MFKKLKEWILPKKIDFFQSMINQSALTFKMVGEVKSFYLENDNQDTKSIFDLIEEAKKQRLLRLKELNKAFITPVDKEAISRVYVHLHWIVLSVKHLVVEIDTYKIYQLSEYHKMFELLGQEMNQLTEGLKMLKDKKYDLILEYINEVIHLDNLLIKAYAEFLYDLFNKKDIKHIWRHKEILSQLKEISKRIHICANHLEDIVFKMN